MHDDVEDEQNQDSLGIGSGTRAKLAEQAKKANDQRDKQRASVGVDGLVYSDESDDDEDDSPRRSFGRTNGNGNGLGNGHGLGSIPSIGASAIPLPTSPGNVSPGGGRRISPSPSPGLADRLEPALTLNSTPREAQNSTIPAKPPLAWNVDDVVSWAVAKGFDDSICDKFKGELILPTLLSGDS